MSPQQIEGKVARVTDDIYALGATLYELLSGHPPFYQNDIAYQVRNVLATPLSERLADLEVENDVPPAVAAIIMACLSKNPEKRPQSARAVAEWIGLTEPTALPITSFASTVSTAPETSEPAKESKETAVAPAPAAEIAAPAPAAEIAAPPPAGENAMRRRLAMLVGSAGLGILAWLAWSHFIPKMPDFPAPLSAPKTNAVNPAGTNVSKTAPIPAPSLAPAPPLSGTTVSIELGKVNRERGLREVTEVGTWPTPPANIGGKECRLLKFRGRRAHCDFQILPAFKRPGAMNARIQVEFYAAAPGVMYILFDGSARQSPHYSNGGRINFEGGVIWKITNYQAERRALSQRPNGRRGFPPDYDVPGIIYPQRHRILRPVKRRARSARAWRESGQDLFGSSAGAFGRANGPANDQPIRARGHASPAVNVRF